MKKRVRAARARTCNSEKVCAVLTIGKRVPSAQRAALIVARNALVVNTFRASRKRADSFAANPIYGRASAITMSREKLSTADTSEVLMPREAKLFEFANGSPARALFKLQGNIPPNWIARARGSRKSLEPDLNASMKKLKKLRKTRPKAHATIKAAEQELKMLLKAWEIAYRKESFYNGLRALLEISRDGKSSR